MINFKEMKQDKMYQESLKDYRTLVNNYLKELNLKSLNQLTSPNLIEFNLEIEKRQQQLKKIKGSNYLTYDELLKKYKIDTSEHDKEKFNAYLEVEKKFMTENGYTNPKQINRMSPEWETYVLIEMEKKGFRYVISD